MKLIQHPNASVVRIKNRRISVVKYRDGGHCIAFEMFDKDRDDTIPASYKRQRGRGQLVVNLSDEAIKSLAVALSDFIERVEQP